MYLINKESETRTLHNCFELCLTLKSKNKFETAVIRNLICTDANLKIFPYLMKIWNFAGESKNQPCTLLTT